MSRATIKEPLHQGQQTVKFLQLKLNAFGPFTDLDLDLSDGSFGLHVIYGPNEAGKSSALRAMNQLLYGIPNVSADAFLHPYKRMRIGGVFRHSDGTVRDVLRRKGQKNTLREADDRTPVDDQEFERFLGGVDADLFQTMFGIDHARLVQGGREILQGGGRIGELLFSAGSGISDLRQIQQEFQTELDRLFKPTGTVPEINRDLTALHEIGNRLKTHQLSVDEWKRHEQALRQAERRKEKLDGELWTQQAEHQRLSRFRDALPAIRQWREAHRNLASYRAAPYLPADFSELRSRALIDLKKAEQQQADAQSVLARRTQDLENLYVPQELLDQAHLIDALRDQLGSYRKAMSDRPELENGRRRLENEMRELLRQLGRSPNLEDIENLRIPADKSVHIQHLGNQHDGLLEKLQSACRESERLQRSLSQDEQALSALGEPVDPGPLRETIRRVQQQGDLEAEFVELQSGIATREQEIAVRLAQLPLWSGSLEELEALPVPQLETVERFEDEFRVLAARRDSLKEREAEEHTTLQELTTSMEQLEREQSVPTEDDLAKARKLREAGWQLVQASWQSSNGRSDNPAAEPDEIEAFVSQFEPARDLAEAYSRSVEAADRIVDRLRREADRVATKAKLQADRERLLERLQSVQREIQEAGDQLDHLQTAWEEQWTPLGIAPLPPREMKGWHRQQQNLAQSAAELRRQQAEADRCHHQIGLAIAELRRQFEAFESSGTSEASTAAFPATEDATLRALMLRAQDQLDRLQQSQSQRSQLEANLRQSKNELPGAEQRQQEAERELDEWRTAWTTEMQRLGLEEGASPAQANIVLATISELFQKYHDAEQYRLRIEGIDREASQFETETREVARRLVPELADRPVEEIVGELNSRLTAARTAEEKRLSLQEQIDEQSRKLDEASNTISTVQAELAAMCQQAGCANADELPSAEEASRYRQKWEQAVQDWEEQLLSYSHGNDLEAFVREAEQEAEDPELLSVRIEELGDRLAGLGGERDEVLKEIVIHKNKLAEMDGSSQAAEQANEQETLVARLEEHVHELAVLRIASAVLKMGIERYRDKNQGPILERASRLFCELTLESFEGLLPDFDDKGDLILTGIRSGGSERVPIEGMSDGTADQLYLALRIASLEMWLKQHEPLPFIVDDILLNFDDGRAVAALKQLASLSVHTQVIFFTHHRHLVELARQHLPEDRLFVHALRNGSEPLP